MDVEWGFVSLVPGTSALETIILLRMLSPSALDRARGLRNFNRCLAHDPDRLFMKLALVSRDSDSYDCRILATLLLKEHFVERYRDGMMMWDRITPENQSSIKSILLTCLQQNSERQLMLKLCETISSVAPYISHWPEMYAYVGSGLSSTPPSEAALLILAEYPMFGLRRLDVEGLTRIKDVFSQLLANDSLTKDLRMAALRATIKLISWLSPENKPIFQDLVIPIMKMTKVVMGDDETNGAEALKLLDGMDPNFLMKEQKQSWSVLGTLQDIAEKNSLTLQQGIDVLTVLEEGTTHSAIHLITNLAESASEKIKIIAPFNRRFLSLLLQMMSDIEEDESSYDKTMLDKCSNYFVGKECFTRFVTAVDEYSIFPIVSELIKDYLKAPNWERKHAALVALKMISNRCSKVTNDNIGLVGSMAIGYVRDPHQHVRWAAADLICHLAVECSSFTVQYRRQAQNMLAHVRDDPIYPRVQERAADAYRRLL